MLARHLSGERINGDWNPKCVHYILKDLRKCIQFNPHGDIMNLISINFQRSTDIISTCRFPRLHNKEIGYLGVSGDFFSCPSGHVSNDKSSGLRNLSPRPHRTSWTQLMRWGGTRTHDPCCPGSEARGLDCSDNIREVKGKKELEVAGRACDGFCNRMEKVIETEDGSIV